MLITFWAADNGAIDLCQSIASAGKLMVAAIDAKALPKSHQNTDKGWWSRSAHRIPGMYWTIYGVPTPLIRNGQPLLDDYYQRTKGEWTFAQFDRCWRMTIRWLHESFPELFQHNKAPDWLWNQVRTDDQGRPMDRDGNLVRGYRYKSDERMSKSFEWTPKDGFGYEWRLDPLVNVSDLYSDSQAIGHARAMCQICADACYLLANKIGAAATELQSSASAKPMVENDDGRYEGADFFEEDKRFQFSRDGLRRFLEQHNSML